MSFVMQVDCSYNYSMSARCNYIRVEPLCASSESSRMSTRLPASGVTAPQHVSNTSCARFVWQMRQLTCLPAHTGWLWCQVFSVITHTPGSRCVRKTPESMQREDAHHKVIVWKCILRFLAPTRSWDLRVITRSHADDRHRHKRSKNKHSVHYKQYGYSGDLSTVPTNDNWNKRIKTQLK